MGFYHFLHHRLKEKNKYMLFVLFLAVVNNLIYIFIPIFQKYMLDHLYQDTIQQKDILIFILITFFTIGIAMISSTIITWLITHLKRSLQQDMIDSVLLDNNDLIKKKGAGAYLVSIFGDSEQMANLLPTNIFELIFQIITTIIILIISLKWSSLFIMIVLPTYLLAILLRVFANKHFLHNFEKGREFVYEINPKVLEYIENRDSISTYANLSAYKELIYSKFSRRDQYFLKANLIDELESQFTKNLPRITFLIFFISSIILITNKQMQISSFIALSTYFSYIFLPLQTAKIYFMNVNRFHLLQNKMKQGLKYNINVNIPKNTELKMENCSFSYQENNILKDISIHVNQHLGMVGLSGEGKTTLIQLLLGKLKPTQGKCLYGEIETHTVAKYILRSSIRYYKQDPELFDEDLQFNICLGKKLVSKEIYQSIQEETQQEFLKVYQAIQTHTLKTNQEANKLFQLFMAKLDNESMLDIIKSQISTCSTDTIKELSSLWTSRNYCVLEKYNQLINDLNLHNLKDRKLGQRGNYISGGEKNRIMLARFLLPEYGKLYIIDEPFTSLDKVSELNYLRILKHHIKDMFGIVISHKLNIIKELSQEIMVLEHGSINDTGTHDNLYLHNTLYKQLIDLSERS